jgi:RNA polymerase sigma factor (sigma-70 family)
VARKAALDALRKVRHEVQLFPDLERSLAEQEHLEADVDSSESDQFLASLLASLGDIDQRILHRRFWKNESIAEIAAAEELSYSATAVRIFRALARLRKRVGQSD